MGWATWDWKSLDWSQWVAAVVLAYVVVEHLVYWRKKGSLPGPVFVIPFFGGAISMVRNPTKFWDDQAAMAASGGQGLSCNMILGKFVVFVRDSELSQRVFANVRPEAFHLVGHPFGKKLFGESNLIFKFGEEHKALRRRLAPLFTEKALGVYVGIQEQAIRKHIRRWLAMAKEEKGERAMEMRGLCREMNLEASQEVFAGPYLGKDERARFREEYNLFNKGLLALPLYIPGCAFYEATQAVTRLVAILGECAMRSRMRMQEGGEPRCLLDFWTTEGGDSGRERTPGMRSERERTPGLDHSRENGPRPTPSDMEIGHHVFDFLFAAQDASTSSLVWSMTFLASNPSCLAKLRSEQSSLLSSSSAIAISAPLLRLMPFTEMFVKETLRFRPPATLVPHLAHSPFPLSPSFTIPRGSIVFPSLFESSFQGFSDPLSFDPDRFSPTRQEDLLFKRNWLLFGAGAHQCLGQRYAINQLKLFTALFATMVDFDRVPTPDCDRIDYTPTIVPKDHGLFRLAERKND